MLSTPEDKQYRPECRRRIVAFGWAIEVDGLNHALHKICDVGVFYKTAIKKDRHKLARWSASTYRCDMSCY